MTAAENRETIIEYWLEKAGESLDAARDELAAGRLTFSVNRAYYACFYAVSALLLSKEMRFKKHSGVRAAFQQHFVKTAKVSREDGRLFDELFESRQRADYMELIQFEAAQVEEYAGQARAFVAETRPMTEDIIVDYDSHGRIFGIEFLNASTHLPDSLLSESRDRRKKSA